MYDYTYRHRYSYSINHSNVSQFDYAYSAWNNSETPLWTGKNSTWYSPTLFPDYQESVSLYSYDYTYLNKYQYVEPREGLVHGYVTKWDYTY